MTEKFYQIRAYNITVASEFGEKSAMFIHQLDYWLNRPKMGYDMDGQIYIKNTYKAWTEPENFPHWTVKTVQRIVEKLKNAGILLVKQLKGKWDRTLFYCLNYSHELLVKCGYTVKKSKSTRAECPNRNGQNVQMNNNTNTTPTNTSNTYDVSKNQDPNNSKGKGTREYREKYKIASAWLRRQEKGFQKEVQKYVDMHCNKSSTKFPIALGMKIKVEIWRKYTEQENHTDFEYEDKEKYKELMCISPDPVIKQCYSLEDEMLENYKGGLYGTSNYRTST